MLDLSDIINITVNTPSVAQASRTFSLALLLSQNTVVPVATRVAEYASTKDMLDAGFEAESPEVVAAGLYFNQSPAPSSILVGTIGASEAIADALAAARTANSAWYIAIVLGAASADIEAAAAVVEHLSPASVLFYTTSDAAVLSKTAGNICATLQTAAYRRTLGQFSSVANAVASIAGYACGANNGLQSFDLMFKAEPGVTPEPLTSAQVTALKSLNCNFLANRENQYTFFSAGVMANGAHYDEVLGIDMLQADIQTQLMAAFTAGTKIPQTDSGVGMLASYLTSACESAASRGFIAGGTWKGGTVGSLQNGDTLPAGYSIQAGRIVDQSAEDISNRVAPPIYICIILAGSLESVVLTVNVNK